MACYPNDGSYLGDVAYYDHDGAPPPGFCLHACTTDADCDAIWERPLLCDPTTGVCE
jgi:hypothetical protein